VPRPSMTRSHSLTNRRIKPWVHLMFYATAFASGSLYRGYQQAAERSVGITAGKSLRAMCVPGRMPAGQTHSSLSRSDG